MANNRISGPVCGSNAPLPDSGTLVCSLTPVQATTGVVPPPRQWHDYCQQGGFDPSALTLSPQAVALLQGIEKLRLKPYDDQTGETTATWVKGATIGYGHLISKTEWATYQDGITKTQADTLFRADANPFEVTVGDTIKVRVQQYEFDAMVILAFNSGRSGFRNSQVAALVNRRDAENVNALLENTWKTSFVTSQGKPMKGLVIRRAAEWRIFSSGIYAGW